MAPHTPGRSPLSWKCFVERATAWFARGRPSALMRSGQHFKPLPAHFLHHGKRPLLVAVPQEFGSAAPKAPSSSRRPAEIKRAGSPVGRSGSCGGGICDGQRLCRVTGGSDRHRRGNCRQIWSGYEGHSLARRKPAQSHLSYTRRVYLIDRSRPSAPPPISLLAFRFRIAGQPGIAGRPVARCRA